MKPKSDEIEVTVFGPGYGECIVIHIGSGKWAIIDSCLDDALEPASLSYLRGLGVAVETDVISVSASHWHDDHVKGLAKTIDTCKAARLSLGSAIRSTEFVAFLYTHESQPVRKLDKGGTELLRCLELLAQSGRTIKPLHEDTLIFDFEQGTLAHHLRVEMRALSPTGKQFEEFIGQRIIKFPEISKGQPKGRISEPSRNDLSVAMLLIIGEQAVLLGADLKQVTDPQKGWNAVVRSRRGRRPRPHVFKIPHHGSHDAHSEEVWEELVDRPSWSVVTPWIRGGHKLPRDSDVVRLKNFSDKCYITSTMVPSPKGRYDRDVIKLIKATGPKFASSIYSGGRVTMRWIAGRASPDVELLGGAKAL